MGTHFSEYSPIVKHYDSKHYEKVGLYMSDQSIGNNDHGNGVQGAYGIYLPPLMPIQSVSSFMLDTLSASSTERSNNMADPMNPRLQQPRYGDIAMQFQLGMAQIVCDMLTKWNKSLQDESERIKEEINSPKYQAWQQIHSPSQIAKEDAKSGRDLAVPSKNASGQQAAITTGAADEKDRYSGLLDRYSLIAGMSNLVATTAQAIQATTSSLSNSGDNAVGISKSPTAPDLSGYSQPTAMVSALAIGAGFVSNFVPNTASSSQVEVKPIQDAWSLTNTGNDAVTQTGGWFSAMWSIGLIYQLSAQNIAELGAGYQKGPHRDLEFAKGYAQNLLNSLDGNAFNINMLALLTPMIEKSPEGKARQNPELLAVKGKVILLAMALALVLKLELASKNPDAQIDESFFAAMLGGGVDFSRNDEFQTGELKRQLVFYFRYNLELLPESERAKIVEGILSYIGAQPKIEDLLDQQKTFESVLEGGTSFEQSLVDKKPIDV